MIIFCVNLLLKSFSTKKLPSPSTMQKRFFMRAKVAAKMPKVLHLWAFVWIMSNFNFRKITNKFTKSFMFENGFKELRLKS